MTRRELRPRPFLRDSTPQIRFGEPRRRRARRVLATVLVAGAGLATLISLPSAPPDAEAQPAPRADTIPSPGPTSQPIEAAVRAPEAEPPAVFARFDGLELHLPSEDVLLVGFHEASLPGALELTPNGVLRANDNTTRVTPPADDPAGPAYVILSSRGRVQAATSAVDLVMRDDDPVLAPVDGTVTDVRDYALYSTHPDTRVEITPRGREDLRLVLIHLAGVAVEVGDEVQAGQTTIAASANRFPFASHIDRYLDQRWPHVHLEVKRPDAPTVLDTPSAPPADG